MLDDVFHQFLDTHVHQMCMYACLDTSAHAFLHPGRQNFALRKPKFSLSQVQKLKRDKKIDYSTNPPPPTNRQNSTNPPPQPINRPTLPLIHPGLGKKPFWGGKDEKHIKSVSFCLFVFLCFHTSHWGGSGCYLWPWHREKNQLVQKKTSFLENSFFGLLLFLKMTF